MNIETNNIHHVIGNGESDLSSSSSSSIATASNAVKLENQINSRPLVDNKKRSTTSVSQTTSIPSTTTAVTETETETSTTKPMIKYILVWNALPGPMSSLLGTGQVPFLRHGCDVTECHVEHRAHKPNRSMDSFDAVVINMRDLHFYGPVPWMTSSYSRSLEQRFVFFNQEPPYDTWGGNGKVDKAEVNQYANYFNWSMTYRNDADIHLYYGSFKPKPTNTMINTNLTSIIKRNTSLEGPIVAWFVSHCSTVGLRENYIGQLKRHIAIDTYGSCGERKKCPRKPGDDNNPLGECHDMLDYKYKFYLSFESCLCNEYVTEKFFLAISRRTVPIVYGGANYSLIAPSHSFIDARQFEDPKELADYLLVLDKNDTLYNEYFAWRDNYVVVSGVENMVLNGFCNLCRKLHQNDNEPKVYSQLVNHWLPENQCTPPKNISN